MPDTAAATTFIAAAMLGYLVGSIPIGLLIGLSRGVDLRQHGSGNIGATNAGRVLGRKVGTICFVLDVLKGLLPVLLAGWWTGVLGRVDLPPATTLAFLAVAVMPMIGHIFPVWLGFRGGKGVATGLGVMLGVFPVLTIAAAAAAGVWLVSAALTRMVGISSCIAALAMPAAVAVLAREWPGEDTILWPYVVVTGLLAALVIWKHRGNIARTIAGTEPRFGGSKGAREP